MSDSPSTDVSNLPDDPKRELYYDHYSDDVLDAHADSVDTEEWRDDYDAENLWVHPDIPLDAETLTDADALAAAKDGDERVFDCPGPHCHKTVGIVEPVTYALMAHFNGLFVCPVCDEPIIAATSPPKDWTPPSKRRRGHGGVRP
jgi:hypothetical protein